MWKNARVGWPRFFGSGALIAVTLALSGCSPRTTSVSPGSAATAKVGTNAPQYVIQKCKLDVAIQPKLHRLEATATLTFAGQTNNRIKSPPKVRLQLHRGLGIDSITSNGKPVTYRHWSPATEKATKPSETEMVPIPAPDDSSREPRYYELDWHPPINSEAALVIRYGGRLVQDIAAGERPGQVHNFEMRAHIGQEGIYLGENGDWYPTLAEPTNPKGYEAPLTQYELKAAQVPGMVLVASGNRRDAVMGRPRGKHTSWYSPFPLQGFALVGGKHEISQRQVGKVLISVHLQESHAAFAPAMLEAVESYLRLYQPLIGAYPYQEFTVVENFFSSGFAFPGLTVLSAGVIERGNLVLRPGLLDHELIHNWWGNGVFVSTKDGNWCEALTSYCANYMHHVLDGRIDKARAKRRNACHKLSRLASKDDKPLSQFGELDGPTRLIGYDKGSMFFAMLADRIGQRTLWQALKQLRQTRLGKPTGWNDIQRILERQSGKSLDTFFQQWVYGAGLPDMTIEDVFFDPTAERVSFTVLQKTEKPFDVMLPIRLVYDNGSRDETVRVNRAVQVPLIHTRRAPKHIEIDPEYRIMRRVPIELAIPTVSGIEPPKPLVIVLPEHGGEPYKPFLDRIRPDYEKADNQLLREIKASQLNSEDREQGHMVFVGRACRSPIATKILEDQPFAITDGSFSIDGIVFAGPEHEVLCCVRNDKDPGGVICFYYGNDDASIKKARVLTFYGSNSIVVFKDGKVVLRKDLERIEQLPVQISD